MDLNEEQQKAVESNAQDILVLAGAGTGKTRVLTARVEYLLSKGISPYDILCFTFTNKAAREMKWRIKNETISISTFHSFCLPYLIPNLGRMGFTSENIKIYSEAETIKIINQIIEQFEPNCSNKELRGYISNIKNSVSLPISSIELQSQVYTCFKAYQETLKKRNALDLDDIIYYFNQLLDIELLEYSYILVDECQDTNPIQYEIIKKLRGEKNHLFMVGDDDQSIYSFRGADPYLILKYKEEFHPETHILTKNYRSTKQIIELSSKLISNNKNRILKQYQSIRKFQAHVEIIPSNNNRHEGIQLASIINQFIQHGYTYNDVAVLYRNKNLIEHLEPYLKTIPHNTTHNNLLELEEIKTILQVYKYLLDPTDDILLENLIQNPIFGYTNQFYLNYRKHKNKEELKPLLDKMKILQEDFNHLPLEDFYIRIIQVLNLKEHFIETQNKLEAFKEYFQDLPDINPKETIKKLIYNLTLDNIKESPNNQVHFMTIHQSKGLEYPIVIILGLEEGILPSYKSNIEEERRILYVAITRAKDNCILMYNKKRFLYGQQHTQKESRFLNEIKE